MSDHSKERGHHRDHNAPKETDANGKRWYHEPHKSWITWVAVVLMLGGIITYVMTMDESKPLDGQAHAAHARRRTLIGIHPQSSASPSPGRSPSRAG